MLFWRKKTLTKKPQEIKIFYNCFKKICFFAIYCWKK
ncbi:Hypothetical Protein SLY_0239 [Strawberry lethal yellows phytoplasma (CPA) str. NZSb11]|uniref:Uncharacterized protein n=1 Tax=Strawberry lethal yellows phytoplasma (CPA) str. NZSb11 TaxID=980422 RepID=R4RNV5_PHYAS|nr:Hypothetical Protein SLY_0239 [Strawberry lethal yellows phytoplasma (CPA) str. NZSb11]